MLDANAFLTSLRTSYRANDWHGLARHLDASNHADVLQLQQGLNASPHLRPSSYSSLCKTFFQDNAHFAECTAAYLLFVRDAHVFTADRASVSPEAALNAFEAFQICYNLANTLLAQQEAAWFVPTLRKLSSTLHSLASLSDATAQDFKNAHASTAARLLSRSLGICAAEKGNEWPSKRNAVFFLANQTLKIYFHLNNLRLCDTVVKNTRDARDFLETQYPKADRVTFSYYMGRMYLYQRRLRKAMHQLRAAFQLCMQRQHKNRRLILIYCITASLPLGIFPRPELLAAFELQDIYGPLVQAIKVGNYAQCLDHLNTWRQWHINKGTYLLLREKLEVVCWRNLARRTLLIAHSALPQPTTGPPTLKLRLLLAAAQVAFKDKSLDIDDIEAMCASLLDQGYLKAYIHQAQMLVLQKGDLFGFPPVSAVRMIGDEA